MANWAQKLKLQHLQTLIALGEQGNLTHVARMMNITQPALSKWLSQLEDEIGITLFERHSKGLRPSEGGKLLLQHAQRLHNDMERSQYEIARFKQGGLVGSLKIGCSPVATDCVSLAILGLLKELPTLNLNIEEKVMTPLLHDLLAGSVDVVVGRVGGRALQLPLNYQVLYTEPVCFVARPDHPLAKYPLLTWHDLANWRWIVWPTGTPIRISIDNALVDNGVETHAAQHGEGRVQAAEGLHGGVWTDGFVMGEARQAQLVLYGDNRFGKALFFPRTGRAFMRFHRIGIHVIAADAVFRSDHVGRHALRHEIGREGRRRVNRPGTAVRTHGHTAHGLDTATNGHFGFARFYLGCGHVHGFEARCAETVELETGGTLIVTGSQHGGAGDVGTLLADRRDDAQNHIVDQGSVDVVAVAQGLQNLRGQAQSRDLVKAAVFLALAAGGPHGVVDIGLGHLGASLCCSCSAVTG